MTTTSCICPKCHGTGKLDWTDNDNGVCYKCEGDGYLGEMPAGFAKPDRELRDTAKRMLAGALRNLASAGKLTCSRFTGNSGDAVVVIQNKLVFRFKYTAYLMSLPDQVFSFGFDSYVDANKAERRTWWTLEIGGEFAVIKAHEKIC